MRGPVELGQGDAAVLRGLGGVGERAEGLALGRLGKNLGESFARKYGNNVRFNKFRDDVPAFESVDGGEYKSIGTANKVLASVKEGTVITIYGEGDNNITLVQIGVPKAP